MVRLECIAKEGDGDRDGTGADVDDGPVARLDVDCIGHKSD